MANPNKKLEKIAKKIARLEKSLDFCSPEEYTDIKMEIEDISRTLSIDEMVWVDDYIVSRHLV